MIALRRLARNSTIAVAVLMAAGVSTAGWMAQAPPARAAARPHAGEAVPEPATADGLPRSAVDDGPECFYEFPTCSSTNPMVQVQIYNVGDTSSCLFSFTVTWGDGKSDTQQFQGLSASGPEATFPHTYDDKPGSYPVSMTGEVLQNTDPNSTCTATGTNLTFDLTPHVGLAMLRFASVKNRTLATPGLPVVKDDGPHPEDDTNWGQDTCEGIQGAKSFDYLACQSPVPDGSPVKDWPVIFRKGSSLTMDDVVFVADGKVSDPELTANAEIRGVSGTVTDPALASTAMKVNKINDSDKYQLEATNLTFTVANVPATPGIYVLYIDWTITEKDTQATISAGDEHFFLYVTAGSYKKPSGPGSSELDQPYETLLDVGTADATGQTTKQGVFDAIWKQFASRSIVHPILDPATGEEKAGPTFKYYSDDYPTIADLFENSPGRCPPFPEFLHENSGHCGNFAQLLAGVLAFQGISAKMIALDETKDNENEGFYLGPRPDKDHPALHYTYMLVGPGLWKFGKKNSPTPYPYGDDFKVGPHDDLKITGSAVTYKSTKPIAQGPVTDPPMLFSTGDHQIVRVFIKDGSAGALFDPSYGNPSSSTGYATMAGYEKSAIAGFAVIYRKEGDVRDPLSIADALDIDCGGDNICYFQAVPYSQSGR